MKKFLASFLTTLAIGGAILYGCSGCASMSPTQQAAMVQAVSFDAASIGAGVDLRDHPDHRALYTVVKVGLDRLIADGTYDPLAFREAVEMLPISELRGENGALIILGAVSIFTLSTGYLDITNSPPLLQAAITGMRDGLAQALQRPGSRAAPVRQITLPPRRRGRPKTKRYRLNSDDNLFVVGWESTGGTFKSRPLGANGKVCGEATTWQNPNQFHELYTEVVSTPAS